MPKWTGQQLEATAVVLENIQKVAAEVEKQEYKSLAGRMVGKERDTEKLVSKADYSS